MAPTIVVRMHPVILFSIVDSHERRNAEAQRVIGTLLGIHEKGAVEITNCFCVPHNESRDEVAVDMDFARDGYELHKKVNPSEVIVGWVAVDMDFARDGYELHKKVNPSETALKLVQQTKFSKQRTVEFSPDLNQIVESVKKMRELLEIVIAYVDDVLAGRTVADNTIGRALMDMVQSIPQMDPEDFQEMLNSNMKDLLMVVYLSQLTRTQLSLHEKLSQL
ncbi:eukaryotic translation initiation factor 3 subunit F-like [Centruroides sculpturatus]|uniref:eukaryotic translation initiation factor 3 subunit F-like n=1 Tax=Centruroides sculpturatus TaxID=218467 RepID=UPI000C6EC5F9|nr:eukaryotic translation initiation factor 3 subunit F-like [Centruroides sculpturatus]